MGNPQMLGLYWKSPIKVDDLGVSLFQETPLWKTENHFREWFVTAGMLDACVSMFQTVAVDGTFFDEHV